MTFAPGVDVATQSGRTIDLFDWTGVTPTGAFTVSSPYTWNLTKLYTTGEVTLAALPSLPGDFNNDGTVDAADYVVWRKTDGTQAGYNTWRTHFGQTAGSGSGAGANAAVPEPSTLVMLILAAAGVCLTATPGRIESPRTHQRVRLVNNPPSDTRFLTHEKCAGKRRFAAFETEFGVKPSPAASSNQRLLNRLLCQTNDLYFVGG